MVKSQRSPIGKVKSPTISTVKATGSEKGIDIVEAKSPGGQRGETPLNLSSEKESQKRMTN